MIMIPYKSRRSCAFVVGDYSIAINKFLTIENEEIIKVRTLDIGFA